MKRLIAAVVLLCVVLTSTAGATILGTVNLENHNNNLSDSGRLWGGGLNGGTYNTGIYSWTTSGGTGLGTLVPGWGFCIELTQGANNGPVDVINLKDAPLPPTPLYGTPMGTTKANYIRELWGRDFDPNWVIGPITNNERKLAEAFSVAVWEIIYEDMPLSSAGWDVNSDGTPGVRGFSCASVEQAATANTWLHSLTGNGPFAPDLYAISPSNYPNGQPRCGQDYLVQLPEPTTIALLGLGALSLLRRKRSM